MEDTAKIDFLKMGGLVPVVVQDCTTKDVLMVAYMNEEAWDRTLTTGTMWYFSRKRRQLWMKGEESGHVQHVREIRLDCDNDCLLIQVEQIGGACDLGYRSCFEKHYGDGKFVVDAVPAFSPRNVYPYSEALSVAIPSGSLLPQTITLLRHASLYEPGPGEGTVDSILPGHGSEVSFSPTNPRDIPRLVTDGRYDAGITGLDCVLEAQTSVLILRDLEYNKNGRGRVPWVLAVPDGFRGTAPADLAGVTILTKVVGIARTFAENNGIALSVEYCLEPERGGNHQPIVQLIESGASLMALGFRPLCPVTYTTAVIVANRRSYSYSWKRRRLAELCEMLKNASDLLPVNTKGVFGGFERAFSVLVPVRAPAQTIVT